jgi:hypothetical protein
MNITSNLFVLQKDLVKDGDLQFTASSNLMSRLDMMEDASITFFHCAVQKCQGMKGVHGVRRFQDSKDRAATSNLKYHAIKCFGKDAVNATFNDTQPKVHDASIFAVFAHQGQRPVKVSHRAHMKAESW